MPRGYAPRLLNTDGPDPALVPTLTHNHRALVQDVIAAKKALEKYIDMHPAFERDREFTLLSVPTPFSPLPAPFSCPSLIDSLFRRT